MRCWVSSTTPAQATTAPTTLRITISGRTAENEVASPPASSSVSSSRMASSCTASPTPTTSCMSAQITSWRGEDFQTIAKAFLTSPGSRRTRRRSDGVKYS